MEAAAKRLQPIAMPMAPVAMAIPAYTCNTYLVAADMCDTYTPDLDPRALQCADESLKSNRKFLLKALVNCPQALDFVDISLRFDPELVKIALGQEYRPPSPKERPSSPVPVAPPKPRSRRSRRAILLDERRRRRSSRSPDVKSARDQKKEVPEEKSSEPPMVVPIPEMPE
eukprot:symbB.v1.2.018318.t1/scaffold1456.1/size117650/8